MNENLRHILGTNVRRLRRAHGMSKVDFCMTAGISRPILDKMERGEANAQLDTLCKVAAALGVEPSDLLRSRPPRR